MGRSLDAYASEIALASRALGRRDHPRCFHHLERAHILGQRRTRKHVHAHWLMFRAGLSQRDLREVVGQVSRIIAAFLFSRIWVPVGNTGRARVSALAPMPIPDDLRDLIA